MYWVNTPPRVGCNVCRYYYVRVFPIQHCGVNQPFLLGPRGLADATKGCRHSVGSFFPELSNSDVTFYTHKLFISNPRPLQQCDQCLLWQLSLSWQWKVPSSHTTAKVSRQHKQHKSRQMFGVQLWQTDNRAAQFSERFIATVWQDTFGRNIFII